MTDRERLIELMQKRFAELTKDGDWSFGEMVANVADHLLSKGVMVLPVNVGDTVYTNTSMQGWYMRKKERPYKAKIVFIGVNNVDNFMNVVLKNDNMLQFNFSQIGKTVFRTKEEAEQALKEREG